jgi:signal transduction histidine kinase
MESVFSSKTNRLFLIGFLFGWMTILFAIPVNGQSTAPPDKLFDHWEYRLGDSPQNKEGIPVWTIEHYSNLGWQRLTDIRKTVKTPKGTTVVWFRIKLSVRDWINPGIYFQRIYGRSLLIYIGSQKVYEKRRVWPQYLNKIIIPLNRNEDNQILYIRAISNHNTFGPKQTILIGNLPDLMVKYFQDSFVSIILGCALALLALIMLICSIFLHRELKKSWISLCLVIFILGIGVATYPNNLNPYFPSLDEYLSLSFDILIFLFFPILTYFFETLFGPGKYAFIRRLWQIWIGYSILCIILMMINVSSRYGINEIYSLFSNEVSGIFCLTQYLILIGTAIYYAWKGNADARIFSIGFAFFAAISVYDTVKFFTITVENPFSLWKWGLLGFVISLVSILGRRLSANYHQVIRYMNELEQKNKELDIMWQEIKASSDQLADLNKTLEQRVFERTQQMEAANDELSATNEELINTLEILKKTQGQLIESEKMAALGQLVAGITHEINTPLGAIRASIGNISESFSEVLEQLPLFFQSLSRQSQEDFLVLSKNALSIDLQTVSFKDERTIRKLLRKQLLDLRGVESDDFADMLVAIGIYDSKPYQTILKNPEIGSIVKMVYVLSGLHRNVNTITIATDRTSKVVFALKSYTHQHYASEMHKVNIIDGLETILTLYNNKIKHGVEITRNYQEVDPVWCYPDELIQVWTNIIDNALYAMEYRGTLIIDISQSDEFVIVAITDNGKGIPDEIRTRIFTPFFTTKPQGEGSGMGLDIVKKTIDKHKGEITVESIPGHTTFKVFIPRRTIHSEVES